MRNYGLENVSTNFAFRRVRALRLLGVVFLFTLACTVARSQDRASTSSSVVPSSELGRENLSRVAASAADVKAVLLKDTGLLVELKRWVAKDATGHGQIISDADLTDDAIFDRLETDTQFRSVATLLVQKYGYLVPTLNPESQAAKEHELLVKERTKWLAQAQEEELAAARQKRNRNVRNASMCDPQSEAGCNVLQTPETEEEGAPGQQRQPEMRRSPAPDELNSPSGPRRGAGAVQRAQLTQTEEGFSSGTSQLPLGNADELAQSLNSSSFDSDIGMARESNTTDGQVPDLLPVANSENRNVVDALATYGVGTARPSPVVPDLSRSVRRDANMSAAPGSSSLNTFQPLERRFQPKPQPPAPELVRAPNPYKDIPSLYDMYVQAIPRPTVPKRFGAEVFENGTRDSQLIPMDLPAGPDYVVGPGDGLSIDLWGGTTQRIYRVVDREGRVSLPEVGPLLVSGKSLADVQQSLQQLLRTEFRRVSADVSLARLRTIRVYEVGDIANPGAYDVSSLSTPLNALFVGGGPTQRGSLRTVKHYRGNQLVEVVDLYDLLLHGVKSDLKRLENGDTVLVPPIGPQVTVDGMVRRPAIYELKDEKNLATVLELAGGLLPTATLRHIEVQRLVAHEKQTMLSFDLPEVDSDSEVTKKLEAFEIHDGDRIRVFPIAPGNQDTVYLEGHVIRPGRYSYRPNMKVTDVIASYKDLLPEPANQYAEIIRLNAPDFHPTVESFDLAGALTNPEQAPVLHALDTVRVFSKFDFENPPTVSVLGDVRGPGTYRTSGQIHLSDAVHLAGGIAPDAKIEDAQVFRYLPDGKTKIFSVSLNLALEGDPTANILLQPRDRLLIHRSPDAIQPASVYVQGEVGKPGRYPLTTNMTISDLIRVGGGLKPSANTQTADLTHYQWLNSEKLSGEHQPITISAALAGDSSANLPLSNGDVLTIRQLPGWNDIGASISVKGEVKNPGTYGIRPGERLSSVLLRAGGFQSHAYAYGAVLQRVQVRELEAKEQNQMILRVKDLRSNLELLPDTDQKQKQAKEMALQQYQTTLTQLSSNPPVGRVAIRISSDINRWKNSAADVEVRAGDTLVIPKRPSFVMVSGQVFNPTAVSYRPGKNAKWYLSQAGGPTTVADKKAIFVIRADGSVIGAKESLWSGRSLNAVLQPGDTVVVPERAIGGGIQWQAVFLATQVASSIASTIFIALRY
ncbi:MAG TPA: SLBB domain-containing protein [Candidatus Dormibacteraeota bacterium]|nr:SLBB domain-containing protein [Candidatus Dormibacteraeota bacterium]